ncbi:hypothetical protein BT63DRAFT_482421 [Microthyrium microscopicum]|uniref:Uncharacterized protein n=1 Tax=Microthyrium microscopicum TaxID=703497 RepID=A0A6A6U3G1_9PEZI|nr:hypothetical protein BT63DRAFT_482421 [Microthyrium microscopicum]
MAHAPPVVEDGYSFADDILYVEVSNKSRHRRATIPELRAILRPSDASDLALSDPVWHWWEAQLLHYGLTPSKTKAVAKTRILDALNKGTLAVPRHITIIESDLKKRWNKKDREAKSALRKSNTSQSQTKTTTTTTTHHTTTTTTTSSVPGSKRKATTSAGPSSSASYKKAKASPQKMVSATTPPKGRGKRTANYTNDSYNQWIPTAGTAQYARRTFPPVYDQPDDYEDDEEPDDDEPDDLPPSYDTVLQETSHSSLPASQPRLGLLNGRYNIESSDLDQWTQFSGYQMTLILTLEGQGLWGAYDFGMHSGIIRLLERPYTASDDRFDFTWRGRENSEGQMTFGDTNRGWIQFLGDGRIAGMITCYGQAHFEGIRVSGNQTRSERDARSMKSEWNDYNEEEYEVENRARWGRSRW